jgi:hypothetical protein
VRSAVRRPFVDRPACPRCLTAYHVALETTHLERGFGKCLSHETFLSLAKYNYSIDFELIDALDRFDRGLISEGSPQPWAWNFEATYRPFFEWEIGMRIERSPSIPDMPETHYGVETTYGFGPHAAVSLEFLRASFADANDRNVANAGLVLRW